MSSTLSRLVKSVMVCLVTLFCFLFFSGEDVTEKLIEPIKVYSEKELIREFEKIGSTLVPDKDWSVRIAAMQRVEGLVLGGLYPLFSICVLNFFFFFLLLKYDIQSFLKCIYLYHLVVETCLDN